MFDPIEMNQAYYPAFQEWLYDFEGTSWQRFSQWHDSKMPSSTRR